jgi:hypothetical protein
MDKELSNAALKAVAQIAANTDGQVGACIPFICLYDLLSSYEYVSFMKRRFGQGT